MMWLLLHYTRLITILKKAADRPIGAVGSAVMLNAKLKPGGGLCIVGLSGNKTAWDWIVSGVHVLPIRLLSKLRGESGYPGMTVARPSESLAEIRHISRTVLPGRRVRRRFWYRYTLSWTKPE